MINIRWNVFETNSSAVHSLLFSPKLQEKSNLILSDDGFIEVVLDDYYGLEHNEYTDQYNKLKYLVTWIYCKYEYFSSRHFGDYSDVYNSYEWRDLEDAIKKYIGDKFNGIRILDIDTDRVGFDHQMSPSENECIVDFYNEAEIINYIFNPYIILQTNND